MKDKIRTIVKYFKPIYIVYFYVMSVAINVLKLFVKTDDKLILFNSFGGKKYDDSPKAIFEAMLNDKRFKGYKFVWAFHEPEKFKVVGAKVIKTDTLLYFITALKARCWITNSGIERGLRFKGRKTFYFNTWHGTTIKKMGSDIIADNKSFGSKGGAKVDVMCCQGTYDIDVFSNAFGISPKRFLKCGLPRNDKLINYPKNALNSLKERLGLPKEKKVILYAPTFREYERDSEKKCVLAPPLDLSKWKKELGDDYCLLFRAHYEVANVMDINEDGFVFNMSDYPTLDDLMIVSDILISDYSSIFFDFSIMEKPMLHFTYDFDEYIKNRGMYFDIRQKLDGGKKEDDILKTIKSNAIDIEKTVSFRKQYVNYYGNATRKSVNCIYHYIGG